MRLVLTIFLFVPFLCIAQDKLPWKVLTDIEFEKKYDEEYEVEILYPIFTDEIKAWESKEVLITGFLLPIDIEDTLYALADDANMIHNWYSHGGPEHAVQLERVDFQGKAPSIDKKITFRGTLRLNSEDVTKLIYILENATLVK